MKKISCFYILSYQEFIRQAQACEGYLSWETDPVVLTNANNVYQESVHLRSPHIK